MGDILGFFGEFSFMSNFTGAKVTLDGRAFPSVEHAFVAAKTLDQKLRIKAANTLTPGQVKRLGRTFVLRPDWEEIKVDVMRDLLMQKFVQQPFHWMLLQTGDRRLEETNTWGDTFWGVCNGVGQNMLGRLLMEIRTLLRELDAQEAVEPTEHICSKEHPMPIEIADKLGALGQAWVHEDVSMVEQHEESMLVQCRNCGHTFDVQL